eukprot:3463734-Amphidinium_carterae.1
MLAESTGAWTLMMRRCQLQLGDAQDQVWVRPPGSKNCCTSSNFQVRDIMPQKEATQSCKITSTMNHQLWGCARFVNPSKCLGSRVPALLSIHTP